MLLPRRTLPYSFAFWVAGYSFLVLLAFSTAPSPLYVLYAHRDHFSSFMITLIYAAYAVGVAGSLCFVSHLSDQHGRRPHLLTAIGLALVSAVLFMAWPSLPGLFAARIACGVSVGLTMGTATAYINELHRARHGARAPGRPQLVSAASNLGGLSVGAFLSGLLAQYAGHPLVLPYLVLIAMLVIAGAAMVAAPETRHDHGPRPAYRPQAVSAPAGARSQFAAALIGVFLAYAGPAVFMGLAGTFLATVVHVKSLAMTGLAIFVVFAVGVVMLMVTSTWRARLLLVTGVILEAAGLALVVVAAWLPAPSLVLFIVGGGVVGAATAALFKGTLGRVVAISPAGKLGETLAGYFLSGYVGLSVPVIGVGIALRFVSARVTLLVFALAVGAGILGTSRILLGRPAPEKSGRTLPVGCR